MNLIKKFAHHCTVVANNRLIEFVYTCKDENELKYFAKNYLPPGDGERVVDLSSLKILGKTEILDGEE